MAQYDYDLFVIGAGSGGVRASRMAAQQGARVAVAENKYLGGTCVNAGCIPKKLFVYASHFQEEFISSRGFGWTGNEPEFDWHTLINNKNKEITRLNQVYKKILYTSKVDVISGEARLNGPNTVIVGDRIYHCDKILIASGSKPFVPDIPGKEFIITSDDAFHLDNLPEKIVIVGGGYIAVEFAGIFNGLGVETHLIHRSPFILRGFDQCIREFVMEELGKKGINLHLNTNVTNIVKTNTHVLKNHLNNGQHIESNASLFATGRSPLVDNLGLETTGVRLRENRAIQVDPNFRTHEPNIYALGDVIGHIQLTPVAIAEAMALVDHLFKGGNVNLDYENIPTAVFCQPNIGTIGLSEEQAIKHNMDIEIYKSIFTPLKHTLSGSNEKTMIKIIVNKKDDKVLGAHMVGAEAGEIIQGFAAAIKMGLTKSVLDKTIGIHPTTAEEFVTLRSPVST